MAYQVFPVNFTLADKKSLLFYESVMCILLDVYIIDVLYGVNIKLDFTTKNLSKSCI